MKRYCYKFMRMNTSHKEKAMFRSKKIFISLKTCFFIKSVE